MRDAYHLDRFITAQEPVYAATIRALRGGTMCIVHMDFIFPRLASVKSGDWPGPFSIRSLDEASAYLAVPVLGGRYRECIRILQRLYGFSASAVFGEVGARRLCASLTLFSEASNEFLLDTMFEVWFDGLIDEETARALKLIS